MSGRSTMTSSTAPCDRRHLADTGGAGTAAIVWLTAAQGNRQSTCRLIIRITGRPLLAHSVGWWTTAFRSLRPWAFARPPSDASFDPIQKRTSAPRVCSRTSMNAPGSRSGVKRTSSQHPRSRHPCVAWRSVERDPALRPAGTHAADLRHVLAVTVPSRRTSLDYVFLAFASMVRHRSRLSGGPDIRRIVKRGNRLRPGRQCHP